MALPDVDTSSNQDQLFIFVAFSFSTIIVALLYLFYSNRIFAALLSSILRIFQINLVVTSIQFAPISGRLLIRNLRLKTVDYTLSVISVVIHYDFWSGKGSSAELSGVELFLYNRLSYYESLLASLNGQELREIKSQSWIISFVPKTTRIKIASIIVGNNDIPDILVAEFKTCVLNGSTNASVSGFKLSIKPNVHYGSCATPRKNWFDILFGKPRPVPLRQWSGLARYHSAAEAEYAKVAQVLECDFKATLSAQLDLEVMECSAAYGPWTDRQRFAFFYSRVSIMNFFYPATYSSPQISSHAQEFKINIKFTNNSIFRIPYRDEIGKIKQYSWIDLKFGNGSVAISLPTSTSSSNTMRLCIEMNKIIAAASLNYSTFLDADSLAINVSMLYSNIWNERRDYTVCVSSTNSKLWLLSSHIKCLADLTKDWSSPSTLEHFIPSLLNINLVFDGTVYLNCNPIYLMWKTNLVFDITVKSVEFYPLFSIMRYSLTCAESTIDLSDPHSLFEYTQVASIASIRLYCLSKSQFKPKVNVDAAIEGLNLTINKSVISSLLNLIENYIGSNTTFRDFDTPAQNIPSNTPAGQSSVSIKLNGCKLRFPDELYTNSIGFSLQSSLVDVELLTFPFHSFFSVKTSPIYLEFNSQSIHVQDLLIKSSRISSNATTYASDYNVNVGSVSGEINPSCLFTFKRCIDCLLYSESTKAPDLCLNTFSIIFATISVLIDGVSLEIEGLECKYDNYCTGKWSGRSRITARELRVLSADLQAMVELKICILDCVEVLERKQQQQEFLRRLDEGFFRLNVLYENVHGGQTVEWPLYEPSVDLVKSTGVSDCRDGFIVFGVSLNGANVSARPSSIHMVESALSKQPDAVCSV